MNFPTRNQRGVVIIWLALFLIVMLAISSLAIDMAKAMATRTQLQNAADAAALAGASAIDPATGELVRDSVVTRAQSIAEFNKAFVMDPEPVEVDAADVVIDGHDVTVTVRREGAESMVTHFAKLFGVRSLELRADATARVAPAQAVDCGMVPLSAIPVGGSFLPGCANSYILKLPGGEGANGNYQALRLPSCGDGACAGMPASGASTYKCLLEHGVCCRFQVGDQLEPEPGNMSGPTQDAIEYRFDHDTDQRTGICYSQYRGNRQRIVIVPITTPPGPGGSGTVTVKGFAAVFLKNIPGSGNDNTILGEFIDFVVPGASGGGTSPPGAAAFAIRLVE